MSGSDTSQAHATAAAPPAVAVEGLRAGYGESYVLHGVSFSIQPAEILLIRGMWQSPQEFPNGPFPD